MQCDLTHSVDTRWTVLAELLTPCPVDEFIRKHWERAPLLVQGAPSARFSEYVDLKDMDELLSGEILRQDDVEFLRDGKRIPADGFLRARSRGG